MKNILLLGGNEALLNDMREYGERIGGYQVCGHEHHNSLAMGNYDLVIMDTLGEHVSPIDTIKQIANTTPMPALALLMTGEGTGMRVQEAFYQYAQAKGLVLVSKLKYPVFFGDLQVLIGRAQKIASHPVRDKQVQITHELLSEAITQRQFEVHFQPKIGLKAGHVIGAEALVRWRHPQHGLLYPDSFIPLVEQMNLMSAMTWLVLEESLNQVWVWRNMGFDFKVAVNFSATTFGDPGVAEQVLAMLREKNLDPDCLSIELTESAMVKNLDILLETILHLYKSGVEISIDDYGTGYSSLHQVSIIPAGEIKIDQSFVRNMLDNPVDHLIVRNTVRMAHSLGMRALAEGVETKRHAMALQRGGCDEAQGYFYSRPVDRDAFIAYAGNNPSREIARYFNLH